MATETWTNLTPDPKVTQPLDGLNPTVSLNWGYADGLSGGAATIVTSGGPAGVTGRYASADIPASVGLSQCAVGYTGNIAFATGQRLTVQMWGRLDVASESWMDVLCIGVGDVVLSHEVGPKLAHAASTWEARSMAFQVPAGTVKIVPYLWFEYTGDGSDKAASGTALAIIPSNDSDYSGPYFDGDTTDVPGVAEYAWLGTANNSPSTYVFTVPELAVAATMSTPTIIPVPNPVIPRPLKPLYLKDFSIQEDSTPIYPSDLTGGAGTIALQVDENGDTPYLVDAEIELVDPAQGITSGYIRNVASDNTDVSLSADSRLALLNVNRDAAAVSGTMEEAFTYYLSLCGITDHFVISPSIQSIPVMFPGFSGNLWEQLKKICSANGIEVSLVSNNVIVRPIRANLSENYRDSSRSWSYDTSQKAQRVEIYQYTFTEVTGGIIYNGFSENQTPLTVDAGETEEFIIPINGSIISLDQPVYTTTVGPGDPGFSAYNAIGSDNLPITAAQWAAQGGGLTVAASEDSGSLVVTVKGPTETRYAPYRIGVSDGDTVYSTLRIHGDALLFSKELHTFHTAVDPDRVTQEVGAVIDSPYIQSDQQLLDAAMGELRYWGGNRRTISVSTRGINRLTENGSFAYATFEDFDAWWDDNHSGADFGDFDTEAPPVFGDTFGKHDAWWVEEVQDDFSNQAFGNIAGARVRTESNIHRIRTATITPAGVEYVAWEDSLFHDHDDMWEYHFGAGATFADFDDKWQGRAFLEFDATPLEWEV